MKVLWFTNVPLPAVGKQLGVDTYGSGGHWMSALLDRLALAPGGVSLGVATAFPGIPDSSFSDGNVRYFVVGQPRRLPTFACRESDLVKCAKIVADFQPDLIHIHGTERFYGLLKSRRLIDVPAVFSLQGLLGPYSRYANYFGALSPVEIFKSIRLIELPIRLGLIWQYIDIKRGARREAKMLSAVEGFLGRTEWDRAHAMTYNRNAAYFHVGEILRSAFYDSQWSLERCDRNTLIYTNAGHPRRGTENLLAAVALLRDEFPGIRLRLTGTVSTRSGYGRFIRRRIKELGIEDRVDLLGYLDDKAMAHELLRTHVFAITSYIENSPNSLAEAMLVGMPCVASYVGGIPDMVRDGDSGLLYPVEDVPLLANKIRRIFLDDDLAVRMGNAARSVANKRHNPKTIVEQLLAAYDKILAID